MWRYDGRVEIHEVTVSDRRAHPPVRRREGRWRIALFQNTPAQFHGRPELARQLTEELRQLL